MVTQLKNVGHGFAAEGEVATTVRRGFKWAKFVSDRSGSAPRVELWNCPQHHDGDCNELSCERYGVASIIGRWTGLFKDIPAALLSIEHEERARTREGLLTSMREAYGPEFESLEPHLSEHVTVLIYYRERA